MAVARQLDSDRRPSLANRQSPACRSGHLTWPPTSAAWAELPCAGLVAREDLQTAEVAAIGNSLERLGLENSLRLLGSACFSPAGSTTVSQLIGSISLSNNTLVGITTGSEGLTDLN